MGAEQLFGNAAIHFLILIGGMCAIFIVPGIFRAGLDKLDDLDSKRELRNIRIYTKKAS